MKRAAVLRRQKAEIEAMPLFAAQVAAEHQSVDEEMAERAKALARRQAETRERHAALWRASRAKLRVYPSEIKAALLSYWNGCGWPAAPEYLLCLFRMFDRGDFVLNENGAIARTGVNA